MSKFVRMVIDEEQVYNFGQFDFQMLSGYDDGEMLINVVSFLRTIRPALEAYRYDEVQSYSVREFLNKAARFYSEDFGENNWRVALVLELSVNEKYLCDPLSIFDAESISISTM